jgi:hypothetical protein
VASSFGSVTSGALGLEDLGSVNGGCVLGRRDQVRRRAFGFELCKLGRTTTVQQASCLGAGRFRCWGCERAMVRILWLVSGFGGYDHGVHRVG